MSVAAENAVQYEEKMGRPLPLQSFTGKVSVIMPAYNEQFQISQAIFETKRVLEESNCDYEIIVVDDGSTDDTFVEASKIGSAHENVHVIKCDLNGGKGNALKFGFGQAKGDLIVFLDADLDLHPEQIHRLYQYMDDSNSDLVIGSKRHHLSKLDYPFHRKIISNTYFFFIKTLFGLPVKDTQTGIKLFKSQVLHSTFPDVLVKRYAFDLELLAIAHNRGFKIAEAPIVLNFKRDSGRIRPRDIYHVLLDTLAIFYRLHILKYYEKSDNRKTPESLDNYTC